MREITYHDRDYLRHNNLIMRVDEEQVHFINGIAAVNAIVSKKMKKQVQKYILELSMKNIKRYLMMMMNNMEMQKKFDVFKV